jgi:DNA-binding transcriptional LysR family regulator
MGHDPRMESFGEIAVFVRVAEARSFTAAAKALGITASGASRAVARLEQRLGARLLERTTRSNGHTTDGAAYYERCARILGELEGANEAIASAGGAPRGRLRVDAPTIIGQCVLAPALPAFLRRYPQLSLDLSTRDHIIDPIAEGIDVVVRMAELRESELLCKKLGAVRIVVAAAPRYLAERGRPRDPADLRKHDILAFPSSPHTLPWRFRTAGRDYQIAFSGRLHTNDRESLRSAALAGLGVAHFLEIHVEEDLAAGALEVVLAEHEQPPRPVYALYSRAKAELPKARAFLGFIEEELRRA